MNTLLTEHNTRLQALSEKFRAQGYEVVIEPELTHIPFDLQGYRPDLLACKSDESLIVEVKQKIKGISIERMQTTAQLIAEHPGWRFIVVTPDDVGTDDALGGLSNYLSWAEISKQAAQIPLIIMSIGHAASLIYIWGLVEALLRRYALDSAIPIETMPFTRMAKHLYSIGELSIQELDMLLAIQESRNNVAHGCHIDVTRDSLESLNQFIREKLSSWGGVA